MLRLLIFLTRHPLVFIVFSAILIASAVFGVVYPPISRTILQTKAIITYREILALEPLNINLAKKIEKRLEQKRLGKELPSKIPDPFSF